MMFSLITDQHVGGQLRHYGEYSRVEAEFLQAILHPGDWVVDAGANHGALSLPMLHKIGPTGVLHAFEPQRIIFHLLQANLAINSWPNATAHYEALGEGGTLTVPTYLYDLGDNYGGLGRDEWASNTIGEVVPITPLDALALPRLDLLKADVEGMEMDVLLGARSTIARCRPALYLENNREHNYRELVEYVTSINYVARWAITPLHTTPNFFCAPIDPALANSRSLPCNFNLYCTPNEGGRPEVEGLPLFNPLTDRPNTCPISQVISNIQ